MPAGLRTQATHNLLSRRIFVTIERELDRVSQRTSNEAVSTVELRSQNAILSEGLRVVKSMIDTGKLFSDAKHSQLQVVRNLKLKKGKNGKESGFAVFRDICSFCNITTSTKPRDFSKPLSELASLPFV